MIAQRLKTEVEAFWQHMRWESPLFDRARQGTLQPEGLGAYLASVLYLIRHTPVYLKLARDAAGERKQTALQLHFANKLAEEQGHDQWAEDDLSRYALHFEGLRAPALPAEPMRTLVHYLREVIDRDPSLYLGYIFLAEYFTVLIAPEWLENLETYCRMPREMLSVIGNHAELDKAHVAAALKEIDELLGPDVELVAFLDVLHTSMRHFENFCREVGNLPQ